MKRGAEDTIVQITAYDEARTTLSPRGEGRRIFAFQLSAAPSASWLALFSAACAFEREVVWRPVEVRDDYLFIDCVVEELSEQLEQVKKHMGATSRRYRAKLEDRKQEEARIARALSGRPSEAWLSVDRHSGVIGRLRARFRRGQS